MDYLIKLKNRVPLALVGGSDIGKVLEQMDLDLEEACQVFEYVFAENGLFACKKNKTIQEVIGEKKLQEFINYCLMYMSKIELPVKRGNFVEFRKGMLNISPIGRSCTYEERKEFVAYDEKHKIRENFLNDLRRRFPVDQYGLHMSIGPIRGIFIGGQISIDVFPVGWDKRFCLQYLVDDGYSEIHFFGDRTLPGGNDHELYEDHRTIGHRVTSPDDTIAQLKVLFK
ncbi:eukaryotic phosphomannomutase [Trichuris suis]|nr:eukaryotic phosphomannomutase [Trichuris suis]